MKGVLQGPVKEGYLPQEIEVWYVLPALRREYAKVLVKEHKLTQKEVSEILQVTAAAISQYLTGKRASSVQFSEDILQLVRRSAARMVREGIPLFTELELVSRTLRVRQVICGICKCSNEHLKNCTICFE